MRGGHERPLTAGDPRKSGGPERPLTAGDPRTERAPTARTRRAQARQASGRVCAQEQGASQCKACTAKRPRPAAFRDAGGQQTSGARGQTKGRGRMQAYEQAQAGRRRAEHGPRCHGRPRCVPQSLLGVHRTNSFYCSWVAAAVLARRAEHMLRLLGVGGNKKEATQDGTTDPANEASEPPAAAAAVGQTPAAVEPALPSKAPGLADVRTEPGHAARQRLVDRIEALVHADLVPPLLPVTKPELLPSKATLGLAFAWKDTDYIITRVLIGGVKGWGHQFSINMHACMPAYVHTCVVSGGPRPTDCH